MYCVDPSFSMYSGKSCFLCELAHLDFDLRRPSQANSAAEKGNEFFHLPP